MSDNTITEFGAQELYNKTITSPVIQGTINAGTGLKMPAFTGTGAVLLQSTLAVTGVSTVSNIIMTGPLQFSTNATLTTNGLALNANRYIAVKDLTGATFYIACADALW